ncbi:GDP-mannose 4,6-dehydratase [Cellulomonas hominis]|uniref:GDP-mannose 4,6-dehydratase n=1 Tax=Cellulomonas hominis TaxID=156981 RepID=UPI00144468A9|nr:GDP-mannose 4,6-dehydratase [Cellulomonas hominis]
MGGALVTGAAGQDGSFLLESLAADGVPVTALVRPGEGRALAALGLAELDVREVDLADLAGLRSTVADVRPQTLYHLGGLSSVASSWQQPATVAVVNGVATAALLEAVRALEDVEGRPVRFVLASSAEIFGSPETSPQSETTPVRPVNPYGASKAYAHQLVAAFRAQGVEASSCILYNHESHRRPESFVTRKITAGVARIVRGEAEVLALGNLDARRDWGWAPDYVRAMRLAAAHPVPDDFVVATGRAHSVRDLVEAAFLHAGVTDWEPLVRVDPGFARPTDAPELVGDASKARRELGWRPSVGFEEMVARMVDHDLTLPDPRSGGGSRPA